jgi:peroxiredoxin
MTQALVLCLAVALPTADADTVLQPGTQLVYRGGVSEVRRDGPAAAQPSKSFDLTLLVISSDPTGTQLYWLVEERGQGAWPWWERFGRLALDANFRPIGPQGPALLYDYGAGRSPIPLLAPFFERLKDQPLDANSKWEEEGWRFEVEGSKQIAERATWQISVENNQGPKRTLWVDREAPLLVSYNERVFMDKGTEFQLEMRMVGTDRVADDEFRTISRSFDTLIALRARLKRPPRSQSDEISADERAVLAAELPKVAASITSGPLVKLVRMAAQELELQQGRADALAKLSSKHVGQPVDKFTLESLGSEELSDADLRGKVTVLHFWDYRDDPLKEPYGQVGYLEFLHNRRRADGLKVYGVAVDGRLQQERTRKAALASVRKLKTFMNLTYPILLDDGKVLKQFDDPRILGAPLPLVVVINPDGKIVHYHVGFYAVDRQDGLKELDAIVADLLEAKEQ